MFSYSQYQLFTSILRKRTRTLCVFDWLKWMGGGIVKHWENEFEVGFLIYCLGNLHALVPPFEAILLLEIQKDRIEPKFWRITYYLLLPIFVVIQWPVLRTNTQNMRVNWNSRWSVLTTSDELRQRAQIWDVLHSLDSVTMLEMAEPWAHYSWCISRIKCYD